MKRLLQLTSGALVAAVLLSGCGDNARKLTTTDVKAFDTATPEIKQSWALAQAAAGTNDFVLSILTLRSMLSRGLSKEQTDAVMDALSTYDAKLMKAVNRGDPAAQKALETLRSPGSQLAR